MKKQLKSGKLVLDRETVVVLQSDTLDAVHGGISAATISGATSAITTVISRVACTTTTVTTTVA